MAVTKGNYRPLVTGNKRMKLLRAVSTGATEEVVIGGGRQRFVGAIGIGTIDNSVGAALNNDANTDPGTGSDYKAGSFFMSGLATTDGEYDYYAIGE
jgi:hypothetical protein